MSKQLQMVVEIEQKKEDKMAGDYGRAQSDLAEHKDRLEALITHKKDYINDVLVQGAAGLKSQKLTQFQSFIAKLDNACAVQQEKVSVAEKVVEQRKAIWLGQRRKRKAIESLIEKQKLAKLTLEAKAEQRMFDEFATNQFFRKQAKMA